MGNESHINNPHTQNFNSNGNKQIENKKLNISIVEYFLFFKKK
jgi:hypothetical protein